MFEKNVNLMLYVEDVQKEKEFWKNIGFVVLTEQEMMGYPFFEMKTDADSSLVITVYAKAFIAKVSPEVLEHKPSLLFETKEIEKLHALVSRFASVVSPLRELPFLNFHFSSPSGMFFAVKGV